MAVGHFPSATKAATYASSSPRLAQTCANTAVVASSPGTWRDPPPPKWSAPRYGFEPEEDRDGEQEAPA